MKVLVATEKPFAKVAIDGIKQVLDEAGYEMALLEKYTDKKELLDAVVDADAIIIRSDIIDAEVIEAAKQLKIVVITDDKAIARGVLKNIIAIDKIITPYIFFIISIFKNQSLLPIALITCKLQALMG